MSTTMRRGDRRHGILHVAMAAVLVLVLVPLSLRAAQSGPPAIAEFAPQAVQQIKQAPEQQLGSGGHRGSGATASPTPTPTPTPPPPGAAGAAPTPTPAVDRGRVRHCVGSPLRQTEDPQSPPCVPYWNGTNNGGATSKGVTATQINVATYDSDARITADLQAFFNQRFEFYGRQLNFQPGGTVSGTCAGRQSDADRVAAMFGQAGTFATQDGDGDGETCYAEQAARDRMLDINDSGYFNEATLQQFAPYIWEYQMDYDSIMQNLGRWACQQLNGKKADHAGDPLTAAKMRKFGMLVETGINISVPDWHVLDSALRACGSSITDHEALGSAAAADPTQHKTAIVNMENAGVTSIFCFCIVFQEQYDGSSAASQGYYPEWLVSSYGAPDFNIVIHTFWPDEQGTLMGISQESRQVPYAQMSLVQAVHSVDPSYNFSNSLDVIARDNLLYHTMLLLSSGIQMAGPNLTPQTFQAALQRTTFPNPDTPVHAAHVGFQPNRHSMTMDSTELWYNPNAPSPYPDEGTGTYCYVGGGVRFSYDSFPANTDQYFQGGCT